MDTLLTKREAADRVRRSPATLSYWRAIGAGPPSFLLAGRVVYPLAGLERWIAEQETADRTHSAAG